MLTTLGIVQPPVGGVQAGASAGRKLGGKSLLEWVVRRVTDCQRLDRVIVVASAVEDSRSIVELVPSDVSVFVGSRPDMLSSFVEALEAFPAESVVRVVADNPYTDPVLIDRLVKTADEHPDCDYISYCFRDGRPAILSAVGIFDEWCTADALRAADLKSARPGDREAVTRYLYSHPEEFNVRLIPAPAELERDEVRLSVDCEEGWERAQAIYDALGAEALDWRRVAGSRV